MNAKLVKKLRKYNRADTKKMAEMVKEMYQRAYELPLRIRLKLVWGLLFGNKEWDKNG